MILIILFTISLFFTSNLILGIVCIVLLVFSFMLKELLYNLVESILDKVQKYFVCPRCNIPVDKKTRICSKCGNKA